MPRFLTALLTGTALLTSIGAANATTLTQSITVGGGTASVTTDLQAIAYNASVNLFNAAAIALANPGQSVTLNDVVLTFNTVLTTSGTVRNTAAQAQTFKFDLNLDSYLGGGSVSGSGSGAQGIVLSSFGAGTVGDVTQDFGQVTYSNLASGTTAPYPAGPNNLSTSPTKTLIDNTSLNAFTGVGSFALNLSTLTTQTFSGGGGNTAANLATAAGSTFTVSYDYTLTALPPPPPTGVPEPASMVLLGAGLLGAGLLRRRAK